MLTAITGTPIGVAELLGEEEDDATMRQQESAGERRMKQILRKHAKNNKE